MITEQAIVTRRVGNRVEVELERGSACGHCELSQGCGTGAIGRLLGRRNKPLLLENENRLQPGDRIKLGLQESALVKLSLLAYGVPLLSLLVAGLLAAAAALPDGWIAVLSVGGFFIGFKISAKLSRTLEATMLAPYIIEIEVNPAIDAGS